MIARLAATALAGFGLSLAFAPTGWWWMAAPAIAVFIGSCRHQTAGRGFLLGAVFGAAFYLALLDWLAAVIGSDAGVGLALYSALWIGITGAGIVLVSRLRLWWLWVPCVWVLQEAISGRVPFGGWGWGRVGFSQDASPLLPWAALAGVPGLSFVLVLAASGLAAVAGWGFERMRGSGARGEPTQWLLPVAALLVVLLAPRLIPLPTQGESGAGPAGRQVGLVQGNVPEAGLDFNARRRAVLDNHVQQTTQLALDVAAGHQQSPDFVLWPENASDVDPYQNADARRLIDAASRSIGAPILLGAVVNDPLDAAQLFNQGIVWDPVTGPGDTYTKRNLVPFGEYVPFRSVLAESISRFDRVPRDFIAGGQPGGLDVGGTRIGDAICFDVAYDDALREAVLDGGRMLVVQTNNATYNGTSQPAQQFAMSRIRAVEHGRAVAVVSTSGLSGMIAPDGSVVPGTQLAELAPGRYVAQLAQRDSLTVSDQLGPAPEIAAALAGLAAVIAGLRRRPVTSNTPELGSDTGQGGTITGSSADLRTRRGT